MHHEGFQDIAIKEKKLVDEIFALLKTYFWRSIEIFISWLQLKYSHRELVFERQLILANLENLKTITSKPQAEPSPFSLL